LRVASSISAYRPACARKKLPKSDTRAKSRSCSSHASRLAPPPARSRAAFFGARFEFQFRRRRQTDHGARRTVEGIPGLRQFSETLHRGVLLERRKPRVHVAPVGSVLFREQTGPAIVGQDLGNGHQFDARIDFDFEALLGMRGGAQH
jgi:hypothetical protein